MYDLVSSARNRISLGNVMRHFSHTRSSEAAAPSPPAANSSDEVQGAIMFTVVLMTILGATLSVVALERLFRGRFTLFSMVQTLLRSTFVLFLPLLSYLFSHTELTKDHEHELLFVLLWMLLIELIRKKVQAMVQSAADGSFSRASGRFRLMDHSDEATRLVWIGYLMYSNIPREKYSMDMRALFFILWSLALAKLGQRVLNKWVAQDSLTAAGNTHLIAGYMQHIVNKHGSSSTDGIAKCKYVVMGEEKLMLKKKDRRKKDGHSESKVRLTTLHCGYGVGKFPDGQDEQKHVHLLIDLSKVDNLVTVETVLEKIPNFELCCFSTKRWRNLCLSFSLFKLMRRRFEHYPMVEVGTEMARGVMLHGLLTLEGEAAECTVENSHAVFEVLQLELDFLDNYYQAGVPFVMSAPWLFIFNFLFSILFALVYFISIGCILVNYDKNQSETIIPYFIIAMLLVMTILAIEITEFLTLYLLSNWFLVHLLCLYVAPRNCLLNLLLKPIIACFIVVRFLVLTALRLIFVLLCRPVNTKKIKIRQVSIRQVCEPVRKMLAWTSQVTLPTKAKVDIVRALKGINPGNCNIALPQIHGLNSHGKTTTEIILQCHLATELLDMHSKQARDNRNNKKKPDKDNDNRVVATRLSRYCMYLVSRTPELLPDDENWISDVYEDMKSCLKKASTQCFCGSVWQALLDMDAQGSDNLQDQTVRDGVKLFQRHRACAENEIDKMWEEMARFWVDLLVYLAPSNDIEGHAKTLASSGGDLIACIWAFCTHAGISRHRTPDNTDANQQV